MVMADERTARFTLEVQMTSRRWMFIHVSHCTMCPLYVSPFLSSISCSKPWTAEKERACMRASTQLTELSNEALKPQCCW
jgi:hypothetical protein